MAIAVCQAAMAGHLTAALLAHFAICTSLVTSSTMLAISADIDAVAVAISQSGLAL